MTTTSVRPSNYPQPARDRNTAAMMSFFIPGMGQMYNGENRKGMLFICVAALNCILFLAMAFNIPILDGLLAFGQQFHMKPNRMLLVVLREAYLGSTVSLIMMGFFISYIFYVVRDAYDHASIRRRRIYPDFVLELPEATSGSYIFHFSVMVALFIIAFFFIIPPMPRSQLTEIEFVEQQQPTIKPPPKRVMRRAEKHSEAAGKHNPNKPVSAPHPQAPKAPSAPAAKPAPPTPHAAAPSPHAAPPTPHAAPPMPHLAPPAPSLTPRPMPMAHAPSAAPAMPHMPTMAAAPAMPHMAPAPMAMPSATPMPMAAAPKSFSPAAMPSLSPSALPKMGSGGGMPTPMARPNGGGGFAGLPSMAPSPIAMGSGGGSGGGTSNFAPLSRSGSGSGGGSGYGPSAPGPVNASSGGGGGKGGGGAGGPVPVAMSGGGSGSGHGPAGGSSGGPAPVRAGRGGGGGGWSSGPISITPSVPKGGGGGGGGDGSSGNPDANNNPNGKPSVAAMADVDFGPYMADLQRRIKRAWFPPRGQESRRVQVIFKIHTDGTLSDLRIEKTSGVGMADKAALEAVQNAAPFRPLPNGAPSVVDIQFTFDYNVFQGRSF